MSTAIYGFAVCEESNERSALESLIADYSLVGPQIEPCESCLYNWPQELLPSHLVPKRGVAVCFSVHDKPGFIGAEYLFHYVNYSPDADIGLPIDKDERIGLFLAFVNKLFTIDAVSTLLIAITVCCEIEYVRDVLLSSFQATLMDDLALNSPPNALYIIKR